jgi:hypothetical protein
MLRQQSGNHTVAKILTFPPIAADRGRKGTKMIEEAMIYATNSCGC